MLYGGVSLAIYIYGVVYELYRLVRASRGVETNAWSSVVAGAGVTTTVDVVSGASAGGINGILLGKALAGGGDLRAVRSLWVDDASLDDLVQSAGERHPSSLLRSSRFELLVAQGLDAMDQAGSGRPLVSAFDLFVAATRLRPWVRSFRTELGGSIQTSDYRKSFNLKYRRRGYNREIPSLGYDRNDFASASNATLMKLARATSAFPAAFEPMKIAASDGGPEFFAHDEPSPDYFSDGGILHNKPFTEAVDAIANRAADRPVRRWLVSVEPDPEHAVPTPPDADAPLVTEVVSKAVFGIPRYQSIAADLDRIQAQQHAVGAARDHLRRLDAEIWTELQSGMVGAEEPLEGRVGRWTYWHDRRRTLLSELHARITSRWDPEQRTERGTLLEEVLGEQVPQGADFTFERRRLYYLLELLGARRKSIPEPSEDDGAINAAQLLLWASVDRLEELLWSLFADRPGSWADPRSYVELTDANDVVLELASRLTVRLEPIRESTHEACMRVDERLHPAETILPGPPLQTVFEQFELWDILLLPLERAGGPPLRQRINLARISPGDAHFIAKSPARKIAGDSLAHFGGFLKREWRRNDILWGRLDAAEIACRILLDEGAAPVPSIDQHIRHVQAEITEEELGHVDGDYRHYLENEYRVGEETLADIPMQERANLVVRTAAVVRNMLRNVADAPSDGQTPRVVQIVLGRIGTVLGFVLAFLRWPVIAIWGEDSAVRRFASLAVLFVGLWALGAALLILLDIVAATDRLWALIAIGLAVFAIWTLLWVFGVLRARDEPGG